MFPAPLRKNGFDVNTTDTGELEIARQDMMKLRPHLQSIDSDNYPDTLRYGDAVLALAWNGTAYLMQQEAKYKDTGYVIPSEGTIHWVDTWVLLADAPHPNAAYAFLNWIQDPNVQVLESGFAGYASCNDAAKPLLDPPSSATRPSTSRTTSWHSCRSRPIRAATSSARTSGRSSSRDDRSGRAPAGRCPAGISSRSRS